jgi:hypothetical protein
MVLPQRVTAEESFPFVPPVLATAAAEYQRACAAESAQLALMAQHNLDEEWSDAVRSTVLTARERIYEVQQARARFREQLREFVLALRVAGESAAAAIGHTRSMIRVLESSGAVTADDARFETDVLAWAAQDYESA